MRPSSSIGSLAVALLVGSIGSAQVCTAQPAPCTMRLNVELTPDVPNPRDPGFLSSLVDDHPAYQLTLVRQDDASDIVVDLSGPGPREGCHEVIETMRKDGRVLSVRPASDSTE
ncbi:MAG: hypothetical protein IRZ28_10720 [Steroidobacteraceae bacterium]|nr:hypothetical protein [Steroidobacteraceae bacterium]